MAMTSRLGFLMDEEDYLDLKALAEVEEHSMTKIVRRLIRGYINENRAKLPPRKADPRQVDLPFHGASSA